MSDICEIQKNSRETICFRLGEYKGHKFVDMRVFAIEEGKDPIATRKGLAVSPQLWPQFKAALAQLESAMIQHGWLAPEDLETQGE